MGNKNKPKMSFYKHRIRYCESPAIGMGAPECSKDCCDYGACHKEAYFKHIADKNNTTPDKVVTVTNLQFDKFIVDDREYNKEEIFEILKKHKEEEDKKYHRCERCSTRYLQNNTINMVDHSLHKKPDERGAWGYSATPYVIGFKILSACGEGREVKLCDHCILELKKWLNKTN